MSPRFAYALALLFLLPCPLVAQPASGTVPAAQPTVPAASRSAVEELKKKVEEASSLTDDQRKEALSLCEKTLTRIASTQEATARVAKLLKELQDVTAEKPPQEPPPLPIPADPKAHLEELSIEQLRLELTKAQQLGSRLRQQLEAQTTQIEERGKRRQDIPELLQKARSQAEKSEENLKAADSNGQPLIAEAQHLLQLARLRGFRTETQLLEQEQRTYEATARNSVVRRDQAEKRLQQAQKWLQQVTSQLTNAQKTEAEQKAADANRAANLADPRVQEAAELNAALAEQNANLVVREQRLLKDLSRVEKESVATRERLDDFQERAQEAEGSPAFGALLRSQQDRLPELGPRRQEMQSRSEEASQLRLQKYGWEALRDQTLDSLEPGALEDAPKDIAEQLRRVHQMRLDILRDLITQSDDNLSTLVALQTAEKTVIESTQELESFIALRVFWVPSATPLTVDDARRAASISTDMASRGKDFRSLTARLVNDAKQHPIIWSAAAFVALGLVVGRRRAKRLLLDSGADASKRTTTNLRPTVLATVSTIVLAAPTPLMIGFLGWRLAQYNEWPALATGQGVMFLAAAYAVMNVVRHACRPGGVGQMHFGWDERGLRAVRHNMRLMQVVALPLLAIAMGVQATQEEDTIASVGRLSLVAGLIATGALLLHVFRPGGPLVASMASRGKQLWRVRGVTFFGPLTAVVTLGIAAASVMGLHYTAIQLSSRMLLTVALVVLALASRALLMRWLLVAYRRVAMQRAREKRQAMLDAQENTPAESPIVDTEPEISLTDINQQARKFVGLGVGFSLVVVLLSVWGDVLPALGILKRFELWTDATGTAIDGVTPMVTLAGLLMAIVVFAMTCFAGSNLPGLLEVSVFQRLPLDAGARYAASSLLRYAIYLAGAVVGFRLVGIGWQSVQWLVAAMTVGLGFGLQEIFANFVSGIILLFERPVRLGDTVTIGDVSGVVTKIRIRATTVQDWDNKELIVPNREFITGNLINWTLSSRMLRLVVKVGVAYGSDTRVVSELLYKIAREHPEILETPEPFVLFNEFGDSTLNFELRIFVTDVSHLMTLKHEVHMAIDDAFRQHGIEIAFPQRDLHLRSVPPELIESSKDSPIGDSSDVLEESARSSDFR